MKNPITIISALSLILSSCYVEHQYYYETKIKPLESDSLFNFFEDELVRIHLYPKPNGINFKIENKTSENMYLLWNSSYFIDPQGNSSKALKRDLLFSKNKIAAKDNYETIIPKKASYQEFTTSSINVNTFRESNSTATYNDGYSRTVTTYNTSYTHSPYWKVESKIDISQSTDKNRTIKNELLEMEKYANQNNQLGIGFALKYQNDTLEYDFKLPITRVFVFSSNSNSNSFTLTDTIHLLNSELKLPKATQRENLSQNELKINGAQKCSDCLTLRSTKNNDFSIGDVGFYEDTTNKQKTYGVVYKMDGNMVFLKVYSKGGIERKLNYDFRSLYKVYYTHDDN